jgi:hypothetical protein
MIPWLWFRPSLQTEGRVDTRCTRRQCDPSSPERLMAQAVPPHPRSCLGAVTGVGAGSRPGYGDGRRQQGLQVMDLCRERVNLGLCCGLSGVPRVLTVSTSQDAMVAVTAPCYPDRAERAIARE